MTIEEWADRIRYDYEAECSLDALRAFADEVKEECKKAIVQPDDGPNLAYSREAVLEAIDSVNMEGGE